MAIFYYMSITEECSVTGVSLDSCRTGSKQSIHHCFHTTSANVNSVKCNLHLNITFWPHRPLERLWGSQGSRSILCQSNGKSLKVILNYFLFKFNMWALFHKTHWTRTEWNKIKAKWMTHLEFVHFLLLLGKDRNYEVRTGKAERQKSWDFPYLAVTGITYEKFSYDILVKGKSLEKYPFEPWEGIGPW